MKIVKSNSKPRFTAGISLVEQQQKATSIYQTKVLPQITARKNTPAKNALLNDAQKAHLKSCNSPL